VQQTDCPAAAFSDAALRQLVETFYGRVRQDPMIGPVFEAAINDWPHHFDLLTRFWASVLRGERHYEGRPMPAHLKLGLTPPMFERWLEHWGAVTGELFAPAEAAILRERAWRIGQAFQSVLFFDPVAEERRTSHRAEVRAELGLEPKAKPRSDHKR
jgi:hemoglobin